jgi:hypothetical protein
VVEPQRAADPEPPGAAVGGDGGGGGDGGERNRRKMKTLSVSEGVRGARAL